MKILLPIIFLGFSLVANAQNVGINTTTPKQKLDVNGKIVLSDDASTPTEGAIRYNSTLKQHEGFNGTEWVTLSAKSTSSLPSNPIPVYGYGSAAVGEKRSALFQSAASASMNFYKVPYGKFLLISGIHVQSQDFITTGRLIFNAGMGVALNGPAIYAQSKLINISRDSPYDLQSGSGTPLWILKEGEYFNVDNFLSSSATAVVKVQGWLVNDLDY